MTTTQTLTLTDARSLRAGQVVSGLGGEFEVLESADVDADADTCRFVVLVDGKPETVTCRPSSSFTVLA